MGWVRTCSALFPTTAKRRGLHQSWLSSLKKNCTGRGVTQVDPTYPIIFDIVMVALARSVLDVVCSPQEAQYRLGWAAGKINLVFYADNGRIAGEDQKWVQDALLVTVTMLHRMKINTNLENTKYMVFMPGFICWKSGENTIK